VKPETSHIKTQPKTVLEEAENSEYDLSERRTVRGRNELHALLTLVGREYSAASQEFEKYILLILLLVGSWEEE
jgi:hypothetical protein